MPFTKSTASVSRRAGVRNLPIISITALGLTVRINTAAKNIAPNTQELQAGISGSTPNSKVVAHVRGMQSKGPTQSMDITASMAAAGLESLLSTHHIVPS